MDVKEKKCNRCKVLLPINKFTMKRDEKYLKMCNDCREKEKIYREKMKCEHGKRRCRCKECKGVSICEHNRERIDCRDCKGTNFCLHDKRKTQCRECDGSSFCKEHGCRKNMCKECKGVNICEHNKQKNECKKCTDPKKIIINNWIGHSRSSDKKYNRYDANNFIDKCFCKGLLEDYNFCYYCGIEFQYMERKEDLVTIERLDNNIGHIKSNCVLACLHCNISRVGDKS